MDNNETDKYYKELSMLVNNPDVWEPLENYLNWKLSEAHKKMEYNTMDANNLFRYQGRCNQIRELLRLKEDVDVRGRKL